MTLQQLRYLIEIASSGSFNSAAGNLYISQSTLSTSIKDLEAELGIEIFLRSNRGLKLTNEGAELLSYARSVIEQANMLHDRFATAKKTSRNRFAVSTQHYAFCVRAFVELMNECAEDTYDFTLRECMTEKIIEDVRDFRSNLGVIYLSNFNERVINRELENANLQFSPLFEANAHVFVGAHHPLAHERTINPEQLDCYPRYSFEQETANSFHFAEEPKANLPHKKNVTYTDRGTLTNLLTHGNGYTLSTGVLSNEMQSGIVAIPLSTAEVMRVGYITHTQRKPNTLTLRYIEKLESCVNNSQLVTIPSCEN